MQVTGISYREDGHGKGAFFDHFAVRKMTGWISNIIAAPNADTTTLASYINYRAGNNKYGLPANENLPEQANDYGIDAAFIFIPGYSRESDKQKSPIHTARLGNEALLIRKAIYRGQPILAVCAGSWTLWQAYGGDLIQVNDHNYGGGMPRLSADSAGVCNNKMLHRVRPKAGTLLAQAMSKQPETIQDIPVNSTHWQALDPQSKLISKNVQVNACSIKDNNLAPNSRQGLQINPDYCVEGFETIHGVPMIAVQWHPEAFNPDQHTAKPHQGIFKVIQDAGLTYLNRRKLNNEFTELWQSHTHKQTSFFKAKTVTTHVIPNEVRYPPAVEQSLT